MATLTAPPAPTTQTAPASTLDVVQGLIKQGVDLVTAQQMAKQMAAGASQAQAAAAAAKAQLAQQQALAVQLAAGQQKSSIPWVPIIVGAVAIGAVYFLFLRKK